MQKISHLDHLSQKNTSFIHSFYPNVGSNLRKYKHLKRHFLRTRIEIGQCQLIAGFVFLSKNILNVSA